MDEPEMPRNVGGRPRYQPTEEARAMVKSMAGFGVPMEMVATVLNISVETLQRHLSDEWRAGKAQAFANMAQTAYQRAMGVKDANGKFIVEPDGQMLRWWLKNFGFGKPDEEIAAVDLSLLDDEEFEWYDRITRKLYPEDEDRSEERADRALKAREAEDGEEREGDQEALPAPE